MDLSSRGNFLSMEGYMVSIQIAALMVALSGAGETVLLDFQAPWCAPCRSMDSTMAELERAGYPVRKVDTDRERNLATQYNVSSIPCFVLLVDGKEAGRVVGATRRAELLALFARANVKPEHADGGVARGQSPDRTPSTSVPGAVARDPFTPARSDGGNTDDSGGAAAGGSAQQHWQDASAIPGSAANPQDLIASSVRLTIEDATGFSYGTGTLVDARQGEALVLTCGHIFRDSQGKGRITVDLFGPQAPQKVPARLIAYDLKNDIGLVSIRPGVPVSVAPVAPKGQRIARGDKVITVGCNNGGAATAIPTKITGIDKFIGSPNLQVAGLPVQGRSGGGLFTADGLVIGVCNAADPADNEGLFAALGAIHDQLDKSGLSAVYQNRPTRAEPGLVATSSTPAKIVARGSSSGGGENAFATSAAAGRGLTEAERATLAEMQKRGDSAEVICIVRSLDNPQAKTEVIMLDRASTAFLKQLAADRDAQAGPHLTSLKVRSKRTPAQAAPVDQTQRPPLTGASSDRTMR
jgi:thiol-disulfide isomerase/thioredoxin